MNPVFSALNELSLSLQGRGLIIVAASEKLAAFKEKLALWIRRVKTGKLINFPCLEETVTEDASLHPDLVAKIVEHLQMLCSSFQIYFSCGELQNSDNWILSPFRQNLEDVDYAVTSRKILSTWGIIVEQKWSSIPFNWRTSGLSKKALEVLVPFDTSYLCEQGFSCLLHIKTKSRNRLNSEHDMRVALSTISPRCDAIIDNK